jgi:hypothetical protein
VEEKVNVLLVSFLILISKRRERVYFQRMKEGPMTDTFLKIGSAHEVTLLSRFKRSSVIREYAHFA